MDQTLQSRIWQKDFIEFSGVCVLDITLLFKIFQAQKSSSLLLQASSTMYLFSDHHRALAASSILHLLQLFLRPQIIQGKLC